MIEDNKGKKIALLSASVLMIGFVLIRFLLFELHGMKQWPFILMLLCLVANSALSERQFRFIGLPFRVSGTLQL